MLAVKYYELIRCKVFIEGKSPRDIAKEIHQYRKKIAKALKLVIPPVYRLSEARPRPAISTSARISGSARAR